MPIPLGSLSLASDYSGSQNAVAGGIVLHAQSLRLDHPFVASRFYRHGWQSWSPTQWLEFGQPVRPVMPASRRPQADDPAHALDPLLGGSNVTALAATDGQVLLLGALGHGAWIHSDGQRLVAEAATTLDWFLAYGEEQAVFAAYAAQLAERLGSVKAHPAPKVWCSWYSYFTEIDQGEIERCLEGVDGLGFQVFQLDDGWQHDMGDWQANAKFPDGMAAMASAIQAKGMRAGLWLAPFIVRPSAKLFGEHPEWLLRHPDGTLVAAGDNWGGDYYALDTTLPAVQDWLRALMQQVRAWGYDYLKLDFLYAAALPGVRSDNSQREDAYRAAMTLLREAMGADAYFLACGCLIHAGLGLSDAMRISQDVTPFWDNEDRRVHLADPSGPSTRVAIENSLHRLWLAPLVHLDPDVVFFRARYNLLSPPQQQHLRDIASICGFVATSDPPHWLDPHERTAMTQFIAHQPQVKQLGRYRFELDGRTVDFSALVAS
jgi:alpha-galactosidase